MSKKKAVLSAAAVVAITLMLFDITIDFELSMPREDEILDAAQEARFDACLDQRDRIIHTETFSNIDNPDVQREILLTEKERAAAACRVKFPERRVAIEMPFQFNVLDFEFRYR